MPGLDFLTECPFRILVAVTFHFRESRLQYLFQVIRALSEFPVEVLDVIVVTNADNQAINQIKDLCAPLFGFFPIRPGSKKTISIESHPKLADPWLLPWSHKHLIADEFLGPASGYTHFIYVEDDILLSFENFCYFVHYREAFRSKRLIPSFQRIEYNESDNRLYLLDQVGASDFESRRRVNADGYAFVNLDYPHNAMFILDQDLAAEYIGTASFDRERSKTVRPEWGLCERASMGLCFESPPEGFVFRYVSPVDISTMTTPRWSWVYHVANNYANDRLKPFAKTRIDQLFQSQNKNTAWRPPSKWTKYLERMRRRLVTFMR
jgi:hypothetical protein